MKLNFMNVPDYTSQKYEPLPEGDYKLMLKSMTMSKSKKDEDMIVCEFSVINDPTGFRDRTIKEFYILTHDFSLSKFKKLLSLSHVDINKEVDIEQLISNGDLLGSRYVMSIKTNSYINQFNKEVVNNKIAGFVE